MKTYLLFFLSFMGLAAFGQDSLTVTANGCDIEVRSSLPRLSKTYDARTLAWDTIAGKVGSVRLDDGSTRDWFYASFLTNFANRDSLFAFLQREQDSCRVYQIDSNVRIVGSLTVEGDSATITTDTTVNGTAGFRVRLAGAANYAYGLMVTSPARVTQVAQKGANFYGAFYSYGNKAANLLGDSISGMVAPNVVLNATDSIYNLSTSPPIWPDTAGRPLGILYFDTTGRSTNGYSTIIYR